MTDIHDNSRLGEEGRTTPMEQNSRKARLPVRKLAGLVAVIVILAITAAITSSTYLERLAELTASLAYLDVIRKEYRS